MDIISAIVDKLAITTHSDIHFTVRQPRDGQLGNIEKVDGIYDELLRGVSVCFGANRKIQLF